LYPGLPVQEKPRVEQGLEEEVCYPAGRRASHLPPQSTRRLFVLVYIQVFPRRSREVDSNKVPTGDRSLIQRACACLGGVSYCKVETNA